jgi:hypothetical protein
MAMTSSILAAGQMQPTPPNPVHDSAKSPEGDCGLVYGTGHSFWVCAPAGWHLDNEAMAASGIHAVFYPSNSSFNSAMANGTVMYANTMPRSQSDGGSLAEAMKKDAQAVAKQYPETAIKALPNLATKSEAASVQQFFRANNYEAVAYVESPQVIVLLVISSTTQAGFDKDYPAFKELVNSYSYFTDSVKVR